MSRPRRVALVGLNYVPRRGTGDKNFWAELVLRLAESLDQITIISIRDEVTQEHEERVGRCLITTRFLSPRLLSTPTTSFSARSLPFHGNVFPSTLGILEKLLSVRRITSQLLAMHAESPLDHIHLMDNFGIANRIIAHQAAHVNIAVSVSAISYMDRNPVVYHPYLLLSYKSPNLTVIPYSRSLKSRLAALGIEPERLHRIPWGVPPDSSGPRKRATDFRASLPGPHNRPLILWAGYLQQIQRADFIFALNFQLPSQIAFTLGYII